MESLSVGCRANEMSPPPSVIGCIHAQKPAIEYKKPLTCCTKSFNVSISSLTGYKHGQKPEDC